MSMGTTTAMDTITLIRMGTVMTMLTDISTITIATISGADLRI